MKAFCILLSLFLLSNGCVLAGGSIAWKDVKSRVAKQDPELIQVIEAAFEVNYVGGALRLGPRSMDVQSGEAEVGDRVPPYSFYCRLKGQSGANDLILILEPGDAGWQFTIRRKMAKD